LVNTLLRCRTTSRVGLKNPYLTGEINLEKWICWLDRTNIGQAVFESKKESDRSCRRGRGDALIRQSNVVLFGFKDLGSCQKSSQRSPRHVEGKCRRHSPPFSAVPAERVLGQASSGAKPHRWPGLCTHRLRWFSTSQPCRWSTAHHRLRGALPIGCKSRPLTCYQCYQVDRISLERFWRTCLLLNYEYDRSTADGREAGGFGSPRACCLTPDTKRPSVERNKCKNGHSNKEVYGERRAANPLSELDFLQ
jgi:hypothetical protein